MDQITIIVWAHSFAKAHSQWNTTITTITIISLLKETPVTATAVIVIQFAFWIIRFWKIVWLSLILCSLLCIHERTNIKCFSCCANIYLCVLCVRHRIAELYDRSQNADKTKRMCKPWLNGMEWTILIWTVMIQPTSSTLHSYTDCALYKLCINAYTARTRW